MQPTGSHFVGASSIDDAPDATTAGPPAISNRSALGTSNGADRTLAAGRADGSELDTLRQLAKPSITQAVVSARYRTISQVSGNSLFGSLHFHSREARAAC